MVEKYKIFGKPSDDFRKRGFGADPLEEPVPGFIQRDDDTLLTGNINTLIVLVRDRTASGNITQNGAVASVSDGYGGQGWQGAGAIDIVVGRAAPYPFAKVPMSPASKESGDVSFDPIFGAYTDTQEVSLEGGKGHPNTYLDAARIYISQLTDIDEAFALSEGLSNSSPGVRENPRSAIAMKADELRMVSRQGIKLVTGPLGGKNGKDRVNSLGGDITSIYGIDLIAGNGNAPEGNDQEPLVKGRKLAAALEELNTLISDLTGIVSTMFQIQMTYNISVAGHWHPEICLVGFPGLPSPGLLGYGLPFYITETMSKLLPSMVNHKINLGFYNINYLTPTFEGYICSRYNSTN